MPIPKCRHLLHFSTPRLGKLTNLDKNRAILFAGGV